jgi:hypothetical protein
VTRRLVVLALALAAVVGCASEKQGLPYDVLRVSVTRPEGTAVPGFPRCVTLPVLNGSVVESEHTIEGGLALEVFATNRFVELSFQGAAAQRTISVEQLRSGFTESFGVASATGTSFTIALGSACSSGDAR